jgi:pilus assembly protein CpaF
MRSGGTAVGKTTLLGVLSNAIGSKERIITIEDSAELKLSKEHLIRLEARPANIEGKGEITIRDLVRNSLRMRPDRIIIGECRGAEAFDMLQAMNTGHPGSLTTIHANSPLDAIRRIEAMVCFAGFDIPIHAIREIIASAIDFIVHLVRDSNGKRYIQEISYISGMDNEHILLQTAFHYSKKENNFKRGLPVEI